MPVHADDCGVAEAIAALGTPWGVLILRDVARGHHRFERLLAESGISRKVLAQRLQALVDAGILEKVRYQERPNRFEYQLTARGQAALPVLAALQDWGDTWILGDGTTSATATPDAADAKRVAGLRGASIPPALAANLLGPGAFTVVYCYPGTGIAALQGVIGGPGCTLESCTYRDRLVEFADLGASVVGVSTQRPDEQRDFAQHNAIQFPLVSDMDLTLTTALRLPTFRLQGVSRLKRLTLVVDDKATVQGTLFPITDVTGSVDDALDLVRGLASQRSAEHSPPTSATSSPR